MAFSNFIDGLKKKSSELKGEVLKFKNKKFLNAATAGSVLIARADGNISTEEKQKMMRLIENNQALSVFSSSDVIASFKEFTEAFEFDADVGDSKAYAALNQIKGDEIQCRTLMRLILSIAAADGVFDQDEKQIAHKIAVELGLNPAEFNI